MLRSEARIHGGSRPGVAIRTPRSESLLLAAIGCVLITTALAMFSDDVRHWAAIPVTLCGILIGVDAVEWLRGRLDIFDPVGLVGLLGFHFYFLAPLLHCARGWWMVEVVPPPDWRPWLGSMAVLNALGLLLYQLVRSTREVPLRAPWRIDEGRFWPLAIVALAATAGLQAYIYARFGGIVGYVTTIVSPAGAQAARGLGWLFTLADTFPTFAIVAWAVFAARRRWARSWQAITLMLVACFFVQMLFGGLRGSRGNTVWGILAALGIVHFWIRPLSRKAMLVAAVVLFPFLYSYGLFKGAGLGAIEGLGSLEAHAEVVRKTGRNLDFVILGDLGRSDVQAFLLYRLSLPDRDYPYAWGRTYLGGLVSVVPRALWPNRPATKVEHGTAAQFGVATRPAGFWSSRQYGLAGEGMLNFGAVAVPLSFLLLAGIVTGVSRFQSGLAPGDARRLLAPVLSVFCCLLLPMDSDNLTLFLLRQAAIPFAVLAPALRRTTLPPAVSHEPA